MNEKEYLTISEAAKLLKVSRKVVTRFINAGKLTTHRNSLLVRGSHSIPRSEVEALLRQQKG